MGVCIWGGETFEGKKERKKERGGGGMGMGWVGRGIWGVWVSRRLFDSTHLQQTHPLAKNDHKSLLHHFLSISKHTSSTTTSTTTTTPSHPLSPPLTPSHPLSPPNPLQKTQLLKTALLGFCFHGRINVCEYRFSGSAG